MDLSLIKWDILQAKGWIGPGLCILCKHHLEDNPHLFMHCPYRKVVWFYCLQVLDFRTHWIGNTLNECMDEWNSRPDLSKNLPLLVCWHIWLDRNNFLFEGKIPSARVTALKVLSTIGSIYTTEKVTILRVAPFNRTIGCSVTFFDGASEAVGSNCGAGGVIKLCTSRASRWYLNCAEGTNTKAKLMGAWATLFLSKFLDIPDIHLLGDSKVVID
jgi:hypothetical protein